MPFRWGSFAGATVGKSSKRIGVAFVAPWNHYRMNCCGIANNIMHFELDPCDIVSDTAAIASCLTRVAQALQSPKLPVLLG